MGEEAAVERYEPGPAFEEVKEETMLDIPPTDSTEFWLIQWIKDKDLLVSDFHGKELSLKLNKDGKLGCLESSTGKSYGVVSFASQQPNATVFLPTGSETKAVGKISRRVCLVRHREHEELKKPIFQSLASSTKKTSKAQKDPKVELQNYAQKRGVQAPLYCVIQGPPHKPLFKSKVVIAGLTFESPEEYHTQKAAERAAAELALTSVPDQLLVSPQSYKDALQKLAEKEHYPLPRYNKMVNTLNTDAPFISTVEFGGEIFKGEPAKTKIRAQINAAKVAFQHFQERRKGSSSSPPVLGGSDMQNAMITPSSEQEIQSGEPGRSVPKISTVTCHKTDDSDAVNSVGNSANRGEQETEESAKQEAQKDPKAELIKYAQKRGVQAPLYCVIQGPPHKPLFKSKVVIAGLTFESPEEYRTRRAAETAAAEIALTSVPDQLLLSSQSYKDALKKLAEKEHYPLPRYNTMVNTLNTDAPFISTVEYGGEIFKGEPAKIKSQAQINAAKVAFQHFEERRKGSGSSPPVIGGSDMQNAMITPSSEQEIQSGEPGSSVPKISTVTCHKTDDSDAVNSVGNSANRGEQETEERESAKQEAQKDPKAELRNYAQKRGVQAPLYCVLQGPPHKPLFKSKVVIAGLTFESPEEYRTRRAAETAAAEIALTSVPDQLLLSSQSYKDALKKLAEKEHYPLPRYNTMVNTLNTDAPFISTVEYGGEIFKGEPAKIKSQAQINAAKVAFQHFEERRKGSGSSPPVIGGSDMQNAMITPSSEQEIQSGEPGSSVPKISTVTCHKTDDSDAGSSKKTLAKKGYCSRQGEQTPEHNSKEDESNVGHPDVSGKTCEGPDAPGAESNTATEMPQSTPEKPPKKKLKITKQ